MAYLNRRYLMNESKQIKLVLFFTRNISLHTWDKTGMFEREVALYRRLQEEGTQVSLVTYGSASDLAYADRLPGIQILCNRWGLPNRLYTRLIPWLHGSILRQANVFKSNQTEGGEVALWTKRVFGKKLITRAGFLWSLYLSQGEVAKKEHPINSQAILRREREAFFHADRAIVTTTMMREYVLENYGLAAAKVQVIPNYVLTDLFIPNGIEKGQAKPCLIYVGRLSQQKNLFGLLEALQGLAVRLVIIGDGPQRQQLEEKVISYGLEVSFLGNQPHHQLPRLLNQADLFILPSIWEGHPKVLLEAMACGLPVIGAKTPGIQELIRHGETGYLCGTSPIEIRMAIQEMISDTELRRRVGRNGREFVVQNLSLDRIVELEMQLLTSLVAEK